MKYILFIYDHTYLVITMSELLEETLFVMCKHLLGSQLLTNWSFWSLKSFIRHNTTIILAAMLGSIRGIFLELCGRTQIKFLKIS